METQFMTTRYNEPEPETVNQKFRHEVHACPAIAAATAENTPKDLQEETEKTEETNRE
jgi:hypothetical protein